MNLSRYAAYKSSGVEWLGKLPASWQPIKLKRLANIQNGKDYKHIETDGDGYPVIGSGGEFANASEYLFKGESVLLGRKGTIDRPLYINGAFWVVDTMFYTKIASSVVAKYLYYCALTIKFDFYSTSTAVPSMTQEDLGNIVFAVPMFEEQQTIARFLDAQTARLDTLVAKKRALIGKLKEKRSALISRTVTRGLPPAAAKVAGLEPHPAMMASEVEWLGEIPAHWEVKRLKYIAARSEVKIDAEEDNPLPYIGMEHVESWTGRLLPLEEELVPTGVSNYFKSGDTLFGKLRPYLAKACNVDFEGLCSSELLVLRGKSYEPRFLLYQLLSTDFIKLVDSSTYGSKMPRASWDFIGSCELTLPPLEEQQAIAAYLDRETAHIDQLIAKVEAAIERLTEYRQALITAAVTGKIDVSQYNTQRGTHHATVTLS